MARRIWKYELVGPKVGIELPVTAKLLSAHIQEEMTLGYSRPQPVIYLYFLLDPDDEPRVTRYFAALNTGEVWPENEEYESIFITTLQTDDIVWHVFERGNKIGPCLLPAHNALIEDGRRCPACLETE